MLARHIWFSSLCSALSLTAASALAGPGNPDEIRYQCSFTQECVGTERPCTEGTLISTALSKNAEGWYLWGSDEVYIGLQEFAESTPEFRSWWSPSLDQDTRSVALLSIAANGRAFLSVQGEFLAPGTVLHVGICTRKVAQ